MTGFDNPDSGGTLGTSTGSKREPGALEVLAGIDKFVTTDSNSGIGLLARPDLPNGIAVDKRVLSIPASPRLDKIITTVSYIDAAVRYTTSDDDFIVARAKRLMQ